MVVEKEVWFRPYESYSVSDLATARRAARVVEEEMGNRPRMDPFDLFKGFLSRDELHINLSNAVVSETDINKYPGNGQIYYPIRQPDRMELVKMNREGLFIRDFGRLSVGLDISEADLTRIHGNEIYPYKLFLRSPLGVFYSIDGVVRPDEDEEATYLEVWYTTWRPSTEVSAPIGNIYVPRTLPSLRELELRFTIEDPNLVY